MQVAEEFDVGSAHVILYYDQEPASPREWANLGTMICWHSRYNLGDAHKFKDHDDLLMSLLPDKVEARLSAWREREDARLFTEFYQRDRTEYDTKQEQLMEAYAARIKHEIDRVAVVLPLYLYDHSGLTMSTAPFSCPWDSGQVGYIYVTFDQARQEHGWKLITKARRQYLAECLQQEVTVYSEYLQGQVYGYVVRDAAGNAVDSLWGIYDIDYARAEAHTAAEQYGKEQ